MCILRIHDIVSACVVWFTFLYRTQEHHAVEDFIIKDLHDSHGSCLWLLPCIPHLYLDYITLLVICQALFLFFFKRGGVEPQGCIPSSIRASLRLIGIPLDILIISYFKGFVKRYFSAEEELPRLRGSCSCYLPLTMIV